jgi:hypothetical protein
MTLASGCDEARLRLWEVDIGTGAVELRIPVFILNVGHVSDPRVFKIGDTSRSPLGG